jgi:L-ascorbate metabolism protein UlaG (beta-lactamase superfamily)
MELIYHGANYVECAIKQAKLGIDPSVPGLNIKSDKLDVILQTFGDPGFIKKDDQVTLNTPGEYETKGFSVTGVSARAHMDEAEQHTATMYRITAAGIRIGVVGHIYPELSDEQLEIMGTLDVLIIPVGGNGYTLDAQGAGKIVRAIEPKVVIPTHYADKEIKYEVPQNELRLFIDELGAPTQEESKYKPKAGTFPEQLTVVVLSRSS